MPVCDGVIYTNESLGNEFFNRSYTCTDGPMFFLPFFFRLNCSCNRPNGAFRMNGTRGRLARCIRRWLCFFSSNFTINMSSCGA